MLPFHNGMKTKEQSQQAECKSFGNTIHVCRASECALQSLLELHWMIDIKTNRKHEVCNWMTVILCTYIRLVSAPFFKITFIITCCFESTTVLTYDVTFLHHIYDSTMISFWVRTEYSASMMQKHSQDWTLYIYPKIQERILPDFQKSRFFICWCLLYLIYIIYVNGWPPW